MRDNNGAIYNRRRYRCQVADYLIDHSEAGGSLAVFGAGECDGIDLGRLVNHFSRITLIDCDETTMKRGILKCAQDGNEKIQMMVRDLVGISRLDYRKFENLVRKYMSGSVDLNSLLRTLNQIYTKAENHFLDFRNFKEEPDGFDYGLILGVHSRLNAPMAGICAELNVDRDADHLTDTEEDPVRRRIAEATEGIVKKFDDAALVAVNRKLITGYETEVNGVPCVIEGAVHAAEDLARREMSGQIRADIGQDILLPDKTAWEKTFTMHLQSFTVNGTVGFNE